MRLLYLEFSGTSALLFPLSNWAVPLSLPLPPAFLKTEIGFLWIEILDDHAFIISEQNVLVRDGQEVEGCRGILPPPPGVSTTKEGMHSPPV